MALIDDKPKVVVLLSGGMDSATLLAQFVRDWKVYPISFRYGQSHVKEMTSALALCEHYKLTPKFVDLTAVYEAFPSRFSLLSGEIPEGHYADANMKSTVVPNRNMLLLSVATAYAISLDANRIAYAAHAGDHTIYPDCRPSFIAAIARTLTFCHFEPVVLYTPFVGMSKGDILRVGLQFQVPYQLTWSCYKGGEFACGKCGTCVERLEAFAQNEVEDPIEYEDRTTWKELLKNA